MLTELDRTDNPDLLVGFDTFDDAGVYRVGDRLALVQTLDLITPVCDDPVLFGQIAAANSLSDVYAMGGRPVTALNICCFPSEGVPSTVLRDILLGAHQKIGEAGATLVGGHTVKDQELKYGLSVTGLIDPGRILTNAGARPGDALVLTKPIGTGVLINGARKDRLSSEAFLEPLRTMARLNDVAAELALSHDARACTDITGFGLAGHAMEVSRGSNVSLRLDSGSIPFWDESLTMVAEGVTTAATATNRELTGDLVRFAPGIDKKKQELFFDPQTSGGLLIALPADRAEALVAALAARDVGSAAVVGAVLAGEPGLQVT